MDKSDLVKMMESRGYEKFTVKVTIVETGEFEIVKSYGKDAWGSRTSAMMLTNLTLNGQTVEFEVSEGH